MLETHWILLAFPKYSIFLVYANMGIYMVLHAYAPRCQILNGHVDRVTKGLNNFFSFTTDMIEISKLNEVMLSIHCR